MAISPTSVAATLASEVEITISPVEAGAVAVVAAMGSGGSVNESM